MPISIRAIVHGRRHRRTVNETILALVFGTSSMRGTSCGRCRVNSAFRPPTGLGKNEMYLACVDAVDDLDVVESERRAA